MTGSVAERSLLGAIIKSPATIGMVVERVTSQDFGDPRLSLVFDGIVQMAAKSEAIDSVTVGARFAEWGVRGIDPIEATLWADADVLSYAAPEYADAVRADSIRRGIRQVASIGRERLDIGEEPAVVATEMTRALNSLVDGSVSGRMMPRSLGEILDEEDDFDWIIEGILERHDRLVLTGPEGGGKSTLARQLVILPAAGVHPLYFSEMEPISALVVDAENTERQWRRAAGWMANRARESGARDPRNHVHIVAGRRIDITTGTDLGQIHRMIDRFSPSLVYIGPLYKLVPRAIMTDDDAAPLITALDSIRERGVALVMEAHAGHTKGSNGERDFRPRGSSALLGWPEFGYGIQPIEEDPTMVSLIRWRGDREQRAWPRHLRRGEAWPWMPCD